MDLEYGGFAIRLKEVRRYEEGFFDEKRVWVIGREREEGRGGEGKEGKEGVLIFFYRDIYCPNGIGFYTTYYLPIRIASASSELGSKFRTI